MTTDVQALIDFAKARYERHTCGCEDCGKCHDARLLSRLIDALEVPQQPCVRCAGTRRIDIDGRKVDCWACAPQAADALAALSSPEALTAPMTTNSIDGRNDLGVRAAIITDGDGTYSVWFSLEDEDDIHPHNSTSSVCVGIFDSFDAATAALVAVQGLRIAAIDTHWNSNHRITPQADIDRLGAR